MQTPSANTYTIGIRDMHLYAYHGVMPQENIVGNEYVVNCSVTYYAPSAIEDDLSKTVSYAELVTIIKKCMDSPAQLLETVSRRVAEDIVKRWPFIVRGYIEIEKTTPPIAGFKGSAYVRLDFGPVLHLKYSSFQKTFQKKD